MDEPPDETLTLIAEVVSDALEMPVMELPPISDAVDPDGLEALVTADDSHDVRISFSYAGLRVFVHSQETVSVYSIREERCDPAEPGHVSRR